MKHETAETLATLVVEVTRLRLAIQDTLGKLYEAEFVVVDGLNQHYAGLTFSEWLAVEGYDDIL